jgi:hypothetical protein
MGAESSAQCYVCPVLCVVALKQGFRTLFVAREATSNLLLDLGGVRAA